MEVWILRHDHYYVHVESIPNTCSLLLLQHLEQLNSTEILLKLGLQPQAYLVDIVMLFAVSGVLLGVGYFLLKYLVREYR